MKLSRRSVVFLLLSVVLAVVHLTFVWINHITLDTELDRQFEAEAARLRAATGAVLDQTYDELLTIATYVANDPHIQALFAEGVVAVNAEGGGAGGAKAAAARRALLTELREGWVEVQKQFATRQLHFHLSPGSTSFLRVHKPEKFGDNMDDVRFTVVDTNREQRPRSGFETGRVYSGLRGVVPVFHTNQSTGQREHIGALEVGTSFDRVLGSMAKHYGTDAAVLLTAQHVRRNMWPEAITTQFDALLENCDCVLEATTSERSREVMAATIRREGAFTAIDRTIVTADGVHYLLVVEPLRDYRGSVDPSQPNVGYLVYWRSVDEAVANAARAKTFTIGYAVLAYLLVEVLLWFAIRTTTRALHNTVVERTREVETQKAQLEKLAAEDPLTGCFNRRGFRRQVESVLARSARLGEPVSMLMLDIDHFKAINDVHGHEAGDQVLVALSDTVRGQLRNYDQFGRLGGEEFAVLLPGASPDEACTTAQRIMNALRALDVLLPDGKSVHFTVSIGFSTLEANTQVNMDDLLHWADEALYTAKEDGRDRAVNGGYATHVERAAEGAPEA